MCLADLDTDGASEVAASLVDEGMDAYAARMDVTSRTEVKDVVDRTVDRYGRLDVLVNNAGVTRDSLLHKMVDEDWR